MRRADVTVTVKAPADACFDFVADPKNTTRFMVGMKSYQPVGRKDRGKGARFATVVDVAGKTFDSELETVEYVPGERIVGVSRSGPKTRGTWSFEEFDDGTTDVSMLWEYDLPGVFRFVPGAGGFVDRAMAESLERLKKLIEADARKPARTAARKKATANKQSK